jgi:hypothetical protein
MGSLPVFGTQKPSNALSVSYANTTGIRSPLDVTQGEGSFQRFNTHNVLSPTVNLPDFDALEAKRIQKLTQKLQEHDEVFDKLHSSKIFIRSDPAPIDIKHTAHHRLINNKNNYQTFLSKEGEQYKVRVFENFKEMSRQMNKAYLRNLENQKYFK